MNLARSGGILLHPTSLPGPFGIGDLGTHAHEFVDWLASAGCRLWQVLPLGPTGYGNSPYQCFSAFAGNPYLVNLELLVEEGLLAESDLLDASAESDAKSSDVRVDYGRVIRRKMELLHRSFQHYIEKEPRNLREEFAVFQAENAGWLDDYSLFMALKELHGGGSWVNWPSSIRQRQDAAVQTARQALGEAILEHAFIQMLFFRQWNALHEHARRQGIHIIGDMPIYAAEDSADVWAHPDLFQLDAERRPTVVGGVPPDYFSPTGQLWGNPLYAWDRHREARYAWWLERLLATLKAVDIVRLDHFRGFVAYWEIPAGNPTAEIGRWVEGPSADLFDTVAQSLAGADAANSDLPLIAEDLGVITPDVIALRERYHLPGMKILQFGFSGADNPFLPHNYPVNCVAYTGTHDNDTARGWFDTAPKDEVKFARGYLDSNARRFSWDLVRAIWSSVAVLAIAPMQDVLGLGPEARMNYPGRPEGNWEWRMRLEDLNNEAAGRLRKLGELFRR
jgi:4-alpha-glucanotransferase